MNEYNENGLNGEENELSLEEAIKTSSSSVNADVNLDEVEDATLDTEMISTFKIDDNMPEELKQQLIRFNQKTESLNNIISDFSQNTESYKDLETEEYYDSDADAQSMLEIDAAIAEDDSLSESDVDNLF